MASSEDEVSGRLTDQEVYMMEMKILNAKCDKCVLSFLQYIQTNRFNFIGKTSATEAETIVLEKNIVQTVLIGLPNWLYQTFVSIQRALPDPPNLEALILAEELDLLLTNCWTAEVYLEVNLFINTST